MSEDDQVVLVTRREQVLVITLNRPQARNAINAALATALAAALDDLDADPDLLVGVITGSPPSFCSGMDLKALVAGESAWVEDRGFAGIAKRSARKPLIAAVEGFAVAGGFEVALACDLIVAANDARFALPEVKRGLYAGGGALLRLPKRVPYHLAMEMALTGDPQRADRLYEFGLINRVTQPGETLEAAFELAQAIVANSPLAVRMTKEVLQLQYDWSNDEAWAELDQRWTTILAAPDAHEGATAFAEKRAPNWRTR